MLLYLFAFLSCSQKDYKESQQNITLGKNQKKAFDLTGMLLIYINSFQHSEDDVVFHHIKNGKTYDFNPSNHLAFREGRLEVFSKNGVSFQIWLLSSEDCPANNYVIEPSQITLLQFFFDSTPQFCIFTHFNFLYSAIAFDSMYNFTSRARLQTSDWIPMKFKKTYSVSEPFLLNGKSYNSYSGGATISYTSGSGKCNIVPIKEGDASWPEIDIVCRNITRTFNLWLWFFIILLVFGLGFYLLIHFQYINLKQYWYPAGIPSNTYSNRVEEHLEIEETPETTDQVDNTPDANNQQPPHDAL